MRVPGEPHNEMNTLAVETCGGKTSPLGIMNVWDPASQEIVFASRFDSLSRAGL